MTIYIIYLLILLLFSVINPFIKKNVSLATKLFVIETLMLIFMSGFRNEVGKDYTAYQDIYNNTTEIVVKEVGFTFIMNIFKTLGLSFDCFSFFLAFITILLTFRFFVKKTPYLFFSILIYFSLGNYYFNTFNAVRQSLAISIFLNVLILLEEGKRIKSITILILTSFFAHLTTLILIPLCFILNKKISSKLQVLGGAIIGLCYPLILKIIELSPYAIYLKMENFATSVPPTYYLILLFAIFVLYLSYRNEEWKENNIVLVNLNYIVLLMVYMLFMSNNTPLVMVFHRLLQYFTIIYVVLIPKIISICSIKTNRYVLISFGSVLFAILCFIALYSNGEENVLIPYHTVFNEPL